MLGSHCLWNWSRLLIRLWAFSFLLDMALFCIFIASPSWLLPLMWIRKRDWSIQTSRFNYWISSRLQTTWYCYVATWKVVFNWVSKKTWASDAWSANHFQKSACHSNLLMKLAIISWFVSSSLSTSTFWHLHPGLALLGYQSWKELLFTLKTWTYKLH